MKVRYKNKMVDIPNESDNIKEFVFISNWNCYIIEITKNERHFGTSLNVSKEYYNSHKYEVSVNAPFGCLIVDGYSSSTIKKCLQEATDNISIDIYDLMNKLDDLDKTQEDRDEIAYWIGMMKDL